MAKVPSKAKLKIIVGIAWDVRHSFTEFRKQEQRTWKELSEEEKMAEVELVTEILKDPTPAKAHNIWKKDKLEKGWRFGEEADEDNQISPLLVPYDELEDMDKLLPFMYSRTLQAAVTQLK